MPPDPAFLANYAPAFVHPVRRQGAAGDACNSQWCPACDHNLRGLAYGDRQRLLRVGLIGGLGLFALMALLLWKVGLDGAGAHAIMQSLVAGVATLASFSAHSRTAP